MLRSVKFQSPSTNNQILTNDQIPMTEMPLAPAYRQAGFPSLRMGEGIFSLGDWKIGDYLVIGIWLLVIFLQYIPLPFLASESPSLCPMPPSPHQWAGWPSFRSRPHEGAGRS